MSSNSRKRPAPRVGKPEFNPTTVGRHQSARTGVRLHLRALHLATVRQLAKDGQ